MKDLLSLFALQLERIKVQLKPPTMHVSGPKRPDLAAQESATPDKAS